MPIDMFNGMQVFTNVNLTESKEVPRSWRERLLSWPWRPWRSTKTIQVPSETVFKMKNGFVMHPVIWDRLQREMKIERQRAQ